jgi:hypothetical protein
VGTKEGLQLRRRSIRRHGHCRYIRTESPRKRSWWIGRRRITQEPLRWSDSKTECCCKLLGVHELLICCLYGWEHIPPKAIERCIWRGVVYCFTCCFDLLKNTHSHTPFFSILKVRYNWISKNTYLVWLSPYGQLVMYNS